MSGVESDIAEWRSFLLASPTIEEADADELESHLRDQIDELSDLGLTGDEAFLIAVKRLGQTNDLSREFGREHSDRLWKQLDVIDAQLKTRELLVVIGLGAAAALAVRLPLVFGADEFFYARNAAVLVVPFVAAYFAWKRKLPRRGWWALLGLLAVAAALMNLYPFENEGQTLFLGAIHLPVALWFLVGYAYTGGDWRSSTKRMNFVRYTGEVFIYYVLIALGGGVLMGLTAALFEAVGVDAAEILVRWVLPMGAAGATLVASWLVEAKQSVIENIAPVLTRIFTPLFALVLVLFLVALLVQGFGEFDRDLLTVVDVLLVVVLGLVLYSLSARSPAEEPGLFDKLQTLLLTAAVLIDLVALVSMLSRVAELGFTPNRAAALGLNVLLLVNLAGAAWLGYGFARGGRSQDHLTSWQTSYLPVFGAWAALVVVALPLVFGFD